MSSIESTNDRGRQVRLAGFVNCMNPLLLAVLLAVWALVTVPLASAQRVVINEIMFHSAPSMPENTGDEYVELYNRETTNVNLSGWVLSSGANFTFPSNTFLKPTNYLVVVAHRLTFTARYPAVTNIVGDWLGQLSNTGEKISLDDASGTRIDSVTYADQGDWAKRRRGIDSFSHRGWTWFSEADGSGKSLELINPDLPNEHGQNWSASAMVNGTPGQPNSVLNPNIAPLILNMGHFPTIPRSTNDVSITARILDESGTNVTVTLFYRVDSGSPPAFSLTGGLPRDASSVR